MNITPSNCIFTTRPRGGYYVMVTLEDGHWFRLIVEESAPWNRTSDDFRWAARSSQGKGPVGHDRTRIGAVRDALRQMTAK